MVAGPYTSATGDPSLTWADHLATVPGADAWDASVTTARALVTHVRLRPSREGPER
jgi:hypothetical protein